VFLRFGHRFPKTKFYIYIYFFHAQTFIVATAILLYDMHNEHFALGISCIWFLCAAVNQFANTSVLSIRTRTAVSYNTRITYIQ